MNTEPFHDGESRRPNWRRAKQIAAAKREAKADKAKRPPRKPPTVDELLDIVNRSRTTAELKLLWRNARDMGLLTPQARAAMTERAKVIGAQHD